MLLAVAAEPIEVTVPLSANSGLSGASAALPSLEWEMETGAIAADGVGDTAALTRTPVEVRKITNDTTKPMEYVSPVLWSVPANGPAFAF
ncbi:hypothetical protein GCM10027093_73390 [Paraburkholderia jirisanensis]